LIPAHKRAIYFDAYLQYIGARSRPNFQGKRTVEVGFSQKDAFVNGFVKFQKEKAGAEPRFIAGRNTLAVLIEKTHITEIEHKYYDLHPFFNYRTCLKEMTNYQVAGILSHNFSRFGHFISWDFSRFDRSIDAYFIRSFQRFISSIYEGRIHPDYLEFCKGQIFNKITSRVGVKAETYGRVMSGDASTSLKNVFICELLFRSCFDHYGWDDTQIVYNNNGDDAVTFATQLFHEENKTKIEQYFARFHMQLRADIVSNLFQELSFCQAKPVRTSLSTDSNPQGWCMVRDPWKVLLTGLTTPNFSDSEKAARNYVSQVGIALATTEQGTPVLSAYSSFLKRITKTKHNAKPDRYFFPRNDGWYWRLKNTDLSIQRSEITETARVDFALAYNISTYQQQVLENYFNTANVEFAFSKTKM